MAAALLLSLLLVACQREPRQLPHEAYVWQRAWTPAVSAALAAQAPRFSGWRVLALQVIGIRQISTTPDLPALATSKRPVRLVVRIEGSRLPLAVVDLLETLGPQVERWRAAGVDLTGIEIDHDCATSALADYASWLRQLRSGLSGELRLSITALPSWLDSPALDQVLAAVDDSVLQVHGVERPDRSLFDGDRARQWTLAFARRTRHPFAVALPAYGVRVDSDAQGRVRAVDAEADIERSGAGGRELRADPREVAAYLQELTLDVPPRLAGFVWFRLPVPGHRRGWSAITLAALIAGDDLVADFVTEWSAQNGGAADIWIRNVGNVDDVPPTIALPVHCRLADALAGYRIESTASGLQLSADFETRLQPGKRIRAGWARCSGDAEDSVQPSR